jgi:FCD domain
MRQNGRARRSMRDHLKIISALERRDAELAEKLVREHTIGLAAHVEKHGDWLDRGLAPALERNAAPPALAASGSAPRTSLRAHLARTAKPCTAKGGTIPQRD